MRLTILAAALTLVAAPVFAEDLLFELINASSANLQELYVSASQADEWGDDILGLDVLAAGEQGTVTIADGMTVCEYDMRFVMDSGVTVDGSANLCELGSFTLND